MTPTTPDAPLEARCYPLGGWAIVDPDGRIVAQQGFGDPDGYEADFRLMAAGREMLALLKGFYRQLSTFDGEEIDRLHAENGRLLALLDP